MGALPEARLSPSSATSLCWALVCFPPGPQALLVLNWRDPILQAAKGGFSDVAPLAACIYRLLKLEGCCLNRTLSFSLLFPFFFLPFSLFVCCVFFFFPPLDQNRPSFLQRVGIFPAAHAAAPRPFHPSCLRRWLGPNLG